MPIAETSMQIAETHIKDCQDFVQTSPLPDELLFALTNRPILIHQPEEFPLITSLSSQKTPAPQQDRASVESELLPPQELTCLQLLEIFLSIQEHQEEPVPSTSTTDHHSVNKTPVHPVEPVLGMTPSENHCLQDRN